jgi:ubiquinone/menaquinone biosynthesis C-methylase UbiE
MSSKKPKDGGSMSSFSDPFTSRQNELPSTYIVQDRQNKEELTRLVIQDQMFTAAMGGVLSEQADPKSLKRILDIGCGAGGWLIQTALSYPTMSLVGIDISPRMIDYARTQAEEHHVAERVKFQVMDALGLAGLPNATFDLVNLRFGSSFLRTWEWSKVLRDALRIMRPGATMRLTDAEILQPSTSAALSSLCEMFLCALYRSNHLFAQASTGLTAHLAPLLRELRYQQVQMQDYTLEYRAGTAEGESFYQDAMHVFRTARPFLQKWGCVSKDYDILYQQLLEEIRQPDFQASVHFLTAWGRTPA